jgi:hypothetical protein
MTAGFHFLWFMSINIVYTCVRTFPCGLWQTKSLNMAHGKRDKHSKRDKPSKRLIAKLTVVKVALVGQCTSERLKEVDVVEQTIVATSSKEGIVSAVKTALKLAGDVICYDFESYGLVRDDKAEGTFYSVAPKRQALTTQGRNDVARSSDEQESASDVSDSETDSDTESEDGDCCSRSPIPLGDVATALRSWTDHEVRSYTSFFF